MSDKEYTRGQLLTQWLRGKGFHIADIKATMEWWHSELLNGIDRKDDEVLKYAEGCYHKAMEQSVSPLSQELPDKQLELKMVLVAAFLGSGLGVLVMGGIKWLVLVVIQSPW